jgi:short-subunit dehydrogenase
VETLRGRTALITGAAGGLGNHIARALALEGMTVVITGRRQDALTNLETELRRAGAQAHGIPADLSDLSAPMLLARSLIGGMLARGHGHMVFISSAAGKLGPAYQQPYAASKAGLIGLTQSLRAEYLGAPVGFSVICPGFIAGDGMYQRMADEGFTSNRLMSQTTSRRVTAQVIRAVREDLPELIETGSPVRPIYALYQLAPGLVERLAPRFGITELYRRVALARGRGPG